MKKVILMLVICLGVFAKSNSGTWYGRNTDKNGVTFNGIETKDFRPNFHFRHSFNRT